MEMLSSETYLMNMNTYVYLLRSPFSELIIFSGWLV